MRLLAFAQRCIGHVVFVFAILSVQQLRRDHDGCRGVEHGDLERHHGEVTFGHRDHARRTDTDPLAAGRAPDQVAGQQPGAEVDGSFVLLEVGRGQQQRLVVDIELDQLRVGDVDDGLADLRESKCVLRMLDLPGLVKPVDVRAVGVRVSTLLGVAAHADVAVADAEQGLGVSEVVGGHFGLDEPPRFDGEPMRLQAGGRGLMIGGHLVSSRRCRQAEGRPVRGQQGRRRRRWRRAQGVCRARRHDRRRS